MPIFRSGESRDDLACAAMHKTKRAPRFTAETSCRGLTLSFHYYGQGAGGFGNVYVHGVTGTTAPLLLMASMQFFSSSWAIRVGFPATVFPSIASWSHAVEIRPFTVPFEHRSNAPPSTKLKLTSSFNAANCAESM